MLRSWRSVVMSATRSLGTSAYPTRTRRHDRRRILNGPEHVFPHLVPVPASYVKEDTIVLLIYLSLHVEQTSRMARVASNCLIDCAPLRDRDVGLSESKLLAPG